MSPGKEETNQTSVKTANRSRPTSHSKRFRHVPLRYGYDYDVDKEEESDLGKRVHRRERAEDRIEEIQLVKHHHVSKHHHRRKKESDEKRASGGGHVKKNQTADVSISSCLAERVESSMEPCSTPDSGQGIYEAFVASMNEEAASYILIIVKDSHNVDIVTDDLLAALNLQAMLEFALHLVLGITLASQETAMLVVQDYITRLSSVQQLRRVICVENSYNVKIHVSVAEVAVQIQLLLQFLLTVLVQIDAA